MDPNTCSNHLAGTHHLFLRGMFTDQLFLSGIAVHGYHDVNYSDSPKLQELYKDFHGKALQSVDVNVLSFTSHVQALLVDYIRDRLEQQSAALLEARGTKERTPTRIGWQVFGREILF